MLESIKLTPDELAAVMSRVAPTGVEYGPARICRYLAENPLAITRNVNKRCSTGNISDVVSKAINPRISDLGMYIGCIRPPQPVYNRYGQPTGQCLWAFFRDKAANEPVYDQSNPESPARPIRSDLAALLADYDEQHTQGINASSEAWEDVLNLEEFTNMVSSVDWSLPGKGEAWEDVLNFEEFDNTISSVDLSLPANNEGEG